MNSLPLPIMIAVIGIYAEVVTLSVFVLWLALCDWSASRKSSTHERSLGDKRCDKAGLISVSLAVLLVLLELGMAIVVLYKT